ncbi:hypothetical protein GCM10007301_20400 [Azorhizobium oxalatiphilum]|uniref:Uncharacterized protein n=1 Tax=Azorhizobium oxalatiphilum TaxID=980631 RepID=A0A917BVR4_9HYPH|nr:hypothetical protein [Azorhizobium oxalatiphilum]GGF60562.1 hypothetical protein GCM10007301_20400 [Azorhizobium oxalatiphilum]
MSYYARAQRPTADSSQDGSAGSQAAGGVQVRILLTQMAQAFVLQSGLAGRITWLTEHASGFHSAIQQGDRVGLSDSSRHDLIVLRRRVLLDPAVLEITLDMPPTSRI